MTQVKTFGCRLNAWESEVIRRHLSDQATPPANTHHNNHNHNNIVVVNTCAVTKQAEKQARQWIRKTRRSNPHAKIIVTGCAAQINPSDWGGMGEVNAVIGNQEKLQSETWQKIHHTIHGAIHAEGDARDTQVLVSDIMQARAIAPHLLSGFDHHSRAFMQIQQGCDHRCTFCIIPYGRGGNRSLSADDIITHCQHMTDQGINEIVLTGVDICSWGRDLAGTPALGELVGRILKEVPRLPRLRLSSLDPAAMDEVLLEVLASEARLMPHLHLSLQHGDGLMLKRMKRRHTPEGVKDLVKRVRTLRPDVVFGADVIAGFPTETASAHQRSCAHMAECDISWVHVFPFSPREGTPAARMPQLPPHVIKQRASEMRALAHSQAMRQRVRMLGCADEVVMEAGGIAHSRGFARLRVRPASPTSLIAGKVYPVRIAHQLPADDSDTLEAVALA
ncbi:MAG: tRNA (N(6)-L-threonylcarbamoyladenosine(37)-C(2))-methylthiotransferase MtaB [Proteobacteria bacterium]|nr:tRNA (N(6)-L-threonylcarbamoyladenosine(37)-C(2))-methylthiotransferase MtaB [Pseudomonadota bacterium]